MLPLHIKKRDARSDIPEGHPVNDIGCADEWKSSQLFCDKGLHGGSCGFHTLQELELSF